MSDQPGEICAQRNPVAKGKCTGKLLISKARSWTRINWTPQSFWVQSYSHAAWNAMEMLFTSWSCADDFTRFLQRTEADGFATETTFIHCLYLHFYRISPNWRIGGGKLSCCPEWNILILLPSGRHLKVHTCTHVPFFTDNVTFWTLVTCNYYGLDCKIDNMIVFVQMMTSCVLLWSIAVEETCSRGSRNRKLHSSLLMMSGLIIVIIIYIYASHNY